MAYSNRAQLRMLASDLGGTRTWGGAASSCRAAAAERQREEVRRARPEQPGHDGVHRGRPRRGPALLVEQPGAALGPPACTSTPPGPSATSAPAGGAAAAARPSATSTRASSTASTATSTRWALYLEGWRARLLLDRGDPRRPPARGVVSRAATCRRSTPSSRCSCSPTCTRGRATRAPRASWRARPSSRPGCRSCSGSDRRVGAVRGGLDGGDVDGCRGGGRVALAPAGQPRPWNRRAVATWLPPDARQGRVLLAPPYAAERAGRWAEAARAVGRSSAAPSSRLWRWRAAVDGGLTEAARAVRPAGRRRGRGPRPCAAAGAAAGWRRARHGRRGTPPG